MPARHRILALGTAVVAALVIAAPANSAPGRTGVTLTATPAELQLVPLPCFAGTFQATMTNTGRAATFADLTLEAEQPLALSRDLFSSYLPAADPDQPVSVPVQVTAPRDTPPGGYHIELESERRRLTVPVQVQPAPPKGPGDNLALGEEAFASSTHGNFSACGGVDGNSDHEAWDTLTGWNDGTPVAFPDTYGVRLPAPQRIDEVTVLTLDSARYPAARYGIKDWDVQILRDGQWHTVAEVRGNTAGRTTTHFAPATAEAVQLLIHGSNDARYSRVVELEARGS